MAQPPSWSSGQNYTQYASQHPSTPFPPSSLDTDFANLRITLDDLLANLAVIQRDDTKLANRSVHPDSLSTATLNLIGEWTPRGDWVTLTRYYVRDMVTYSDVSYVSNTTHVSDASFALDLARGYWQPVSGAGTTPIDPSLINFSQSDVVLGRATAGPGPGEEIPFTPVARQLSDDTTFAAMRVTLGLQIGVDVEAWSAELDAVAALNTTGFVKRTGVATWVTTPSADMAIGGTVVGGSAQSLLWVDTGPVLAQSSYLVWDEVNFRLGVSMAAPLESLHVDGAVRIDNLAPGTGHAISLKFGDTLTNSDGALVQYVDSSVVGYGAGAMVCGLGYTNASWGWTDVGLLLNTGMHLAWTSGNIQASVAEVGAIYMETGAPNNAIGNNNDFLFRPDGTSAAGCIYHKEAGVWVNVDNSGGGIAIGDAVGGGTVNSVLYVGAGSLLAQENATFSYNESTNRLLVGAGAATLFSDADNNEGFGATALDSLSGGLRNIAFGRNVLTALTTGSDNIAIGDSAEDADTNGARNVAIGTDALGTSNGGVDNVAVGYNNLKTSASSDRNVAIGSTVMAGTNISGDQNVGIGYQVFEALTSGSLNIAIGTNACDVLTTGSKNIAIGGNALINETTGVGHVAIGMDCFSVQRVGSTLNVANVGVGQDAGQQNAGGVRVTAIGNGALKNCDDSDNTALGHYAGDTLATGNQNTFIGSASDGADTKVNQTSLGYQATCTDSNQVTLGNGSVATLRCQQTSITALSDARDKRAIEDIALGLDFINALRPRRFEWNMRDGSVVGRPEAGFIAQELQELGEKWLGLVDETNPDRLEATPGRLLPVMVKAIQELSAEVARLKGQLH